MVICLSKISFDILLGLFLQENGFIEFEKGFVVSHLYYFHAGVKDQITNLCVKYKCDKLYECTLTNVLCMKEMKESLIQ